MASDFQKPQLEPWGRVAETVKKEFGETQWKSIRFTFRYTGQKLY